MTIKKQNYFIIALMGMLVAGTISCSKDNNGGNDSGGTTSDSTYVLGVGINSTTGTTAFYAVKTNSITTGTISAVGNGLTLAGYRDFTQGNNTVFAAGGLDATDIDGITLDASGKMSVGGTASLDRAADDMMQVDDEQMLALNYPTKSVGDNAEFNFINISSKTIAKTASSSVVPLTAGGDYPIYTGSAINNGLAYVSYTHFTNDGNYKTNHVDTNYIAIYSYPDMVYQKSIYDTRTGPSGAWNTRDGLFKDENGDIYAMSACDWGYSKATTKERGFLRIKNGESTFDQSYFFKTGDQNGKISHIKYLGNGKAFALISTININRPIDFNQWSDSAVKMSIVDVYTQTITDVKLAGGSVNDLIHVGNGGRSFAALYDNGKVYYTATIKGVSNIYVIDVATVTAIKGAKVDASFVGGIFKISK